jgi:CspA family cold shock protein
MSSIVKILISLAVAAVATAITILLAGQTHAATFLFIAFCGATLSTALLLSITGRGAATAPREHKTSARGQTSTVARSAPRGSAEGAREHGQVKWFNVSKGFGFITKDDGEEIFVHFRSIRGGGRRGLRDGQKVSFIVAQSDKGPQAEDVEGID